MSQRTTTHIAALRRHLQQVQQATGLGLVLAVGTAILMIPNLPLSWSSVLITAVFFAYGVRKVSQIVWTRRVAMQLLLESQFIQHGPLEALIRVCLQRPDHLWTRSLTLKGLKSLDQELLSDTQASYRERLQQHYRTIFTTLFPSRYPLDLLLLLGVAALWLWIAAAAYRQAIPPFMLIGLCLFFLVFVAELTTFLLRADLRHGLNQLLSLLTAWLIAQGIEKVKFTTTPKRYRHTLLYRAPTRTASSLRLPAERLQEHI